MSKPIVNLSYSKETGEFNLLITNAEEVQYVLVYSADNQHAPPNGAVVEGMEVEAGVTEQEVETESEAETSKDLDDLPFDGSYVPTDGEIPSVIEHALTSAGSGNDKFIFTETQLAGTSSSGSDVLHNVRGGTLKTVIITPDGKQYRINQKFLITESGEVKITSTETVSKPLNGEFEKVLGESTEKKETQKIAQAKETYTMEREVSEPTPTNDAWILPAGIAAGIAVIFVIALIAFIIKKKKGGKPPEKSSYAHSELSKGIGEEPVPVPGITPDATNSLHAKVNGTTETTSTKEQTQASTEAVSQPTTNQPAPQPEEPAVVDNSDTVFKRLPTSGNPQIPQA